MGPNEAGHQGHPLVLGCGMVHFALSPRVFLPPFHSEFRLGAVRAKVILFSLTGLGGFLRSPEGAHVFYSTGVINSLGHMLRLGCQDTASRIPARRENPTFSSKTHGKICEFLFQPGFVAPNWRMLQIPLGGHSPTPWKWLGRLRRRPRSFSLPACPSALCSPFQAGVVR